MFQLEYQETVWCSQLPRRPFGSVELPIAPASRRKMPVTFFDSLNADVVLSIVGVSKDSVVYVKDNSGKWRIETIEKAFRRQVDISEFCKRIFSVQA